MREVFDAISRYADAYSFMERHQDGVRLAKGDQKTGVIAEFYGLLYAITRFPNANVAYATPSTKGWDLEVRVNGVLSHRIQVKAVSGHSETGRVSPVHAGWDDLYLMRLDRSFRPIGFWVIDKSAEWANRTLKNRTMPERGKPGSGSVELRETGTDKLAELLCVLRSAGSET